MATGLGFPGTNAALLNASVAGALLPPAGPNLPAKSEYSSRLK